MYACFAQRTLWSYIQKALISSGTCRRESQHWDERFHGLDTSGPAQSTTKILWLRSFFLLLQHLTKLFPEPLSSEETTFFTIETLFFNCKIGTSADKTAASGAERRFFSFFLFLRRLFAESPCCTLLQLNCAWTVIRASCVSSGRSPTWMLDVSESRAYIRLFNSLSPWLISYIQLYYKMLHEIIHQKASRTLLVQKNHSGCAEYIMREKWQLKFVLIVHYLII